MFLIHDSMEQRHQRICEYDKVAGIILSAVDFEWTVRRAILALGKSPTKEIREGVLKKCSGLEAYKEAWKEEVFPRLGVGLPGVIGDWSFFKAEAYPLRHRIVHGIKTTTGDKYAETRIKCMLNASRNLVEFSALHGGQVYGKKIVRLKVRG